MSDNVTVIVETGQALVTVTEAATTVATVTLRESVVTVEPTEVHVTIDEHEAHLVDVVEHVALVDVESPSISVEVEERVAAVVDVVAAGVMGPPGPAGEGVPEGGTTGQVLAKASDDDYDTEWVDPTGGAGGGTGWSPMFAVVIDGERNVLQVVDWTGGTGDKPGIGMYLGPDGFVLYVEEGTDIRGLQGLPGTDGDPGIPGTDGNDGWTPLLAVVEDGERRVLQVVDWDGGEGEKPGIGMYVGPDGFTLYIEDATDIRGGQGAPGTPGTDGDPGIPGADGDDGWTPLLAVVPDGDRRVLQVMGWTGGEGEEPAIGYYIGPDGPTIYIEEATDIRGLQGIPGLDGDDGDPGTPGVDGDNGWSPVLAVVTDGERRVFQIVDWVGGEGTKPSVVNQFVGAAGIVSTAAAAVDIRGPAGAGGGSGALPAGGLTGQVLAKASDDDYDTSWVDLAIGDITGLQDALDDKADIVHVHDIDDTIGLQAALDAKADDVHTHDAADTVSGIFADARMPTRIGIAAKTITDWNDAIENGWYRNTSSGTDLNLPGVGAYVGIVSVYSPAAIVQLVWRAGVAGEVWRRQMLSSVWGAWVRLVDTQSQMDALYAAIVHTHSAADITSGTIANARLPVRLSSTAFDNEVANWNLAVESGFYRGLSSATNSPTAHAYVGIVARYSSGSTELIQILYRQGTGGTGTIYQRWCISGAFGAWTQVINTQAAMDALYAALVHVHSAADITSGTLDEARLEARLASTAFSNETADWNSALSNGWYRGSSSASNSPTAHAYVGIVARYSSGLTELTQIVFRQGSGSTGIAYQRWCIAGTFGSWVQLVNTKAAMDALYAALVHTHDAADTTSGIFIDGRLQTRLRASAGQNEVADANLAIENGWWRAVTGAANIPTNTSYVGHTLVFNSTTMVQTVWRTGTANFVYRRQMITGVWGSWVQLQDTQAQSDALYAALVHTHAAADITSGTFADGRMPSRLGTGNETALTITDWNDALESGFYRNSSSAAANIPDAAAYQGMCISYSNVHKVQLIWRVGLPNEAWKRQMISSVWSAWERVIDTMRTFTVVGNDANDYIESGFYGFSSAMTNGPPGSSGVVVIKYTSGFIVQRAWAVNPAGSGVNPPQSWIRVYDGAWGAWYQTYMTAVDLDARYADLVHVHSAADITSGELADARFPNRLKTTAVGIGAADYDDQQETGWFAASTGATNLPSSHAYFVHVKRYNATNIIQTAYRAGSGSAGFVYRRSMQAGTWSAWERVLDTASAIEAAIGPYAPTASPAFTGNPTAPTASPGDSDTTIANTAFVAAAVAASGVGDVYNGVGNKTGNYTLVLADAGKNIHFDVNGAALTIPNNATVAFPIGTKIYITFFASGSGVLAFTLGSGVTVRGGQRSGSDSPSLGFGNAGGSAASCTLWKVGTDVWITI